MELLPIPCDEGNGYFRTKGMQHFHKTAPYLAGHAGHHLADAVFFNMSRRHKSAVVVIVDGHGRVVPGSKTIEVIQSFSSFLDAAACGLHTKHL